MEGGEGSNSWGEMLGSLAWRRLGSLLGGSSEALLGGGLKALLGGRSPELQRCLLLSVGSSSNGFSMMPVWIWGVTWAG